ncbi:2-oxoacid:ferredoxin oxidoreductase subunit beta [Acidobacteriota bacterium]
MYKLEDYHLQDPTWCRGCGLYGLFSALKNAVLSLKIKPEKISLITGIGCHGRLNSYFNAYGFHSLHGRALPIAQGVKLTNPKLSVVAVSGDGDAYSIGLGHFIHALRRNVDMTYIVSNNRIYGLTQGQTSPTSRLNFVSHSTPYGSNELPLEGPQMALAAGGTFIARGFSGAPKQLAELIEAGMQHTGFSLVEVLSPCVTHNKIDTYQWFKSFIHDVNKDKNYDFENKNQAWEIFSRGDKLPVGLIYKEARPSFEELSLVGQKPIAFLDLSPDTGKIEKILDKFS